MEKDHIISNYIPLLKGFVLYDILLVLEKLKNNNSNNGFIFTLNSFCEDFLDTELFLETEVLLNVFKIDKYYLNDFWVGDSQTWFFLTYDFRFLGLQKQNPLILELFFKKKYLL